MGTAGLSKGKVLVLIPLKFALAFMEHISRRKEKRYGISLAIPYVGNGERKKNVKEIGHNSLFATRRKNPIFQRAFPFTLDALYLIIRAKHDLTNRIVAVVGAIKWVFRVI